MIQTAQCPMLPASATEAAQAVARAVKYAQKLP